MSLRSLHPVSSREMSSCTIWPRWQMHFRSRHSVAARFLAGFQASGWMLKQSCNLASIFNKTFSITAWTRDCNRLNWKCQLLAGHRAAFCRSRCPSCSLDLFGKASSEVKSLASRLKAFDLWSLTNLKKHAKAILQTQGWEPTLPLRVLWLVKRPESRSRISSRYVEYDCTYIIDTMIMF